MLTRFPVPVPLPLQSANMPSKQKKDIRADITRTMQEHPKFKTKPAQAELDRILSAYCVRNPTVGYVSLLLASRAGWGTLARGKKWGARENRG